MSASFFPRLLTNASRAESCLTELKMKLGEIRKAKLYEKVIQLTAENKILEEQIKQVKEELIRFETQNGKKQIPVPSRENNKQPDANPQPDMKSENKSKVEKKSEEKTKKEKGPAKPAIAEAPIDIRRLDLRIGKIVEVEKHPDADSLYIEKIDCGEENLRTVVSGLVNHVPIDEMRQKMVMVLCNLKPVKMRGVMSEAMVMCASSPDKVEVLIPPKGSAPGDLVHCQEYPREPDVQLNPKKKIFETCAPDLNTDQSAVACYKGKPLYVPDKGNIVAKCLKGVPVK